MTDTEQREKPLEAAIAAIEAGDRQKGREILDAYLWTEHWDELAWLWRARAADTDDERRYALRQALAINPDNEQARGELQAATWSAPQTTDLTHPPLEPGSTSVGTRQSRAQMQTAGRVVGVLIVLTFAVFVTIFAISGWSLYSQLQKDGVATRASIVRRWTTSSGGRSHSTSYYVAYAFNAPDANGALRQFTGQASVVQQVYEDAESVEILYSASDPTRSVLQGAEAYVASPLAFATTLDFLVIAWILLAICIRVGGLSEETRNQLIASAILATIVGGLMLAIGTPLSGAAWNVDKALNFPRITVAVTVGVFALFLALAHRAGNVTERMQQMEREMARRRAR